jgi:hypothetical protein
VIYVAWTLLSAFWSHAPARALLGFDRGLLYLLTIAMASMAARRPGDVRILIRGVTVGLAVISGAGLLSRTLPHVFPIRASFDNQRLSYPITYWNVLGMLAALGVACCVYLASDRDEPPLTRILAAGLIPPFASTLLLTFSRGAIGACVAALVLYVAIAPTRTVIGTLLASAPTSAIAVFVTYRAGQLASLDATCPARLSMNRQPIQVSSATRRGRTSM